MVGLMGLGGVPSKTINSNISVENIRPPSGRTIDLHGGFLFSDTESAERHKRMK